MVLHKRDEHRPDQAKQQHRAHLALPAEHHADGDARQRAVPQRVRKERHLVIHRHRAQHAEQRGEQNNRDQRVLHKGIMQPLKGQKRVHQGIYAAHTCPPLV